MHIGEIKMSNNNYKVYMHISPSGKKYIGITRQSLKKRFDNGRGYKRCYRFKKAIDKYGWDNIEHYLIKDNLSKEEAIKMEIYLVEKYDTTNNKNGYNCSKGGNIPHITEETRRKRSIIAKNRVLSEEVKNKIRESNKNKVISKETREKMSKSQRGKKISLETRKKMSLAKKGKKCSKEWIENANKRKYKKINMYDIENNYIKTFNSIKEACEHTGAQAGNITKCLKGERNTCAGYLWKLFEEDVIVC